MPRPILAALALILVLVSAAAVAAATAPARVKGGKLTLVAYSTPRDAYAKLIAEFAKTSAGRGTSFEQSYGA